MIKTYLHILTLFTLTVTISSCNGQVKNEKLNNKTEQVMTLPVGTTKFKKSKTKNVFNVVICSLTDKKGNLWFGTMGDGLHRFDGKEFVRLSTKEGLSNDNVLALYEDKNGILWVGTADGISTWDGKSFTKISMTTIRGKNAIAYQPTTFDPNFGTVSLDNSIDEIMQDSKGAFWFGGGKGLFRYDGTTFTNFTINDDIANNTGSSIDWIEKIAEDKEGNIWFGGRTTNGLFKFDGKTLSNIKPNNEPHLYPLFQNGNDELLFGSFKTIYTYKNKQFEPLSIPQGIRYDNIVWAFKDKSNIVWLGSDSWSGMLQYDGTSVKHIPATGGAENKNILSITADKDNNLWLATVSADIYKYDGKTFTLYSE